jgi:hypothetical protein|tara:strand:+ start:2100 stop:3140 length:1041 start_codon:yes stop_codon:yes gene_type:complete
MKKILFIIKTIFIILLFNSYSFAGVSTPTPTTALNKIASSMSHSAKNNAQTTANISSATSTLLNSSKLTAGIQESAAKFGLSIDTGAATILAGVDTSSSASISKAMAQLESNISGRGEDYVPTLDQDTIVYETDWFALEKVTTSSMNSFTYASTHDVFKQNVDQLVKGKVYVNFKKREMWADMAVKLTLTQETPYVAAGVQQQASMETGTATFTELPVIADQAFRISQYYGMQSGTGYDQGSEEFNTMKASATTLQATCCSGDSFWDDTASRVSEYNHDTNSGGQDAWKSVYMYGKFTTASEGGTALGQLAMEGGHHDDNSDEAAFVASIERQEASGSITGKAYEK